MGAVYLAEHPGIGRKVAIKVLRSELDHNPQLLTRFLNEARAANAIRHPNIIEVLDSGTTAKGISYLVMELLEGESLSARIRRLSRLDERSAVEIAMQTASGLGAAHAKGIIHRDLKPDNLFIIPEESDASRERVKILDFGIAKLHVASGDSLKTRTGTLMGTPVYMSPEQCLGTKEVDHRSDVYSLGIIIYEMLAGRPPFVSEGFGELLSMHLHETPPPLQELAPQVSDELEFVVRKTLAKKADDRYPSMAEVRAALAAATGLPHPLVPDHKLGDTDQLGVRATLEAHAQESKAGTKREAKPVSVAPTTLTPGGLESPGIHGTTMRVRRRTWLPFVVAAGVAIVAVPVVLLWRRPAPAPTPRPVATQVATTPPPLPGPAKPSLVRIRLGSTPPGARVIRVADGAVLGTTPETIELRPSAERLPLRFEKDGFLPALRETALDTDAEVSATLEAEPAKATPPSTRKATHSHSSSHGAEEPAKL